MGYYFDIIPTKKMPAFKVYFQADMNLRETDSKAGSKPRIFLFSTQTLSSDPLKSVSGPGAGVSKKGISAPTSQASRKLNR